MELMSATDHTRETDHVPTIVADVIQDEALTELLKIGDRLHESMGTDLDGTEFKDGEIESLILLSASTAHLIAELRAARSQRAEARAALADAHTEAATQHTLRVEADERARRADRERETAVAVERERIATAIEALRESSMSPDAYLAIQDAARIARSSTDGGCSDE